MLRTFRAALVSGALITATQAAAQEPPIITLRPADPDRWDVAAHVGWLGGNKSEIAPDWNDWYDTASFDVSAGYYLTPHLKVEVDVSTAAEAGVFSEQFVQLPGSPFPYVRSREHRFRTTGAAAGATYQFFENVWFHPFIGGGLAVVHETERTRASQPFFFRDPQTGVVLPEQPPIDKQSTTARPLAMLGFKAYVSEWAFVRTDLRVTASTDRVETVVWRGGVGFDF
jgi:hypothetical protein